ncbi:MAG: hypothetical protein R6W80_18075 [Haliea sp.]
MQAHNHGPTHYGKAFAIGIGLNSAFAAACGVACNQLQAGRV